MQGRVTCPSIVATSLLFCWDSEASTPAFFHVQLRTDQTDELEVNCLQESTIRRR